MHCDFSEQGSLVYNFFFLFKNLKIKLFIGSRWLSGKECLPMQEMQVQSPGQEDPLEKEMAICSSILAWKIPWTEESGRPQSMGLQRVGHD